MNNVIMQLRIELSKTKKDFSECELKLKRLFWELQSNANPYYKSISEIKAEELEQCADEILKIKKEALILETRIKELENQLGD